MGDCIGVIAKNTTNIGAVIFAALTIGAPVNPLDISFTSDDIAHMFGMTKPKLVFCDSENVTTLKDALLQLGRNATIVTIGARIDGCDFIDDYLVEETEEENFMYGYFFYLKQKFRV